MTYDEFEEEVLQSDCCPKNFPSVYKEFRAYQELAINTLKEFHNICEKNHIVYQLAYGSLLGAIRDGGQIPWDYDVDVFVHYENRLDLIHALEKDMCDKYYYTWAESKKKPEQYFIRIAPQGYNTDYIHVDVFFLVGLPDGESKRIKHVEKIKRLLDIYTKKNISFKGSFFCRVKMMLFKIKHILFSNKRLLAEMEYSFSEHSSFTSKYCIASSYTSCCDNDIIERIMLDQIIRYDTRDGCFYIPANYKPLLNRLYGDYETYPPVERRISEMLSNYTRLKYMTKQE